MSVGRKVLIIVVVGSLGLVGCRHDEMKPPAAATMVLPAQPSVLRRAAESEVSIAVARSQPVDLWSGMPVRRASAEKSSPYPLVKAGFAYHKGVAWPQLLLDPALTGELPPATRNSFLPAAIAKTVAALPASPVLFCATPAIAMSLDAGPRQHWITRQVKSLTGGLWDQWFGDEKDSSIVSSPGGEAEPLVGLPAQSFLAVGGEVTLQLKGQLTGQGLVVSSDLLSTLKPALHLLYLERRDCQQAWPGLYQVHRFWASEEAASVEYRASVSQADRGRFLPGMKTSAQGLNKEGRLAAYRARLLAQAPLPIWELVGAQSPEQGAQALSSYFGKVSQAVQVNESVLVLHVVTVADTRYTTEAMLFRMQVGGRGVVHFTRI